MHFYLHIPGITNYCITNLSFWITVGDNEHFTLIEGLMKYRVNFECVRLYITTFSFFKIALKLVFALDHSFAEVFF